MEHEVFVPVPAERLREVLDDPARVARAVPGLQQDAGAEPVTGRLKIRVGSHSVTYRGAVRVSRRDDAYAVEGEAEESRGSGSVKIALRIALREAEDGCTLVYEGTAAADGRITEFPGDAVEGAVTRLLNRFAEQLAAAAPESTTFLATQDFEPRATTDHETTPDADDEAPPPPPVSEGEGDVAGAEGGAAGEKAPSDPGLTEEPPSPERPSSFGADVPLSPPGPARPARPEDDEDGEDGDDDADDEDIAEAAHARRTMIGRSAEEVDHAPPRGRYAPVPAPQTVTATTPLRWAAPAAALALASAVVAVRALRRRR
ncbi:SRPBCC domain-containing protein [Streptomyces sp. NPDC059696]|uniref:SRPBCC domain-containing protein n=1 Tax=Streptomyces sp. NPDC059696 TaxID=3346911 RepID=UPI0036C0E0BC